MRYELSDYEWTAIKPMLPNKSRGVRRVNDRRVLNGIIWVLRSGAPWRDPICFSPYLYRARNLVERFFNKIKQCLRVATRYDKLAANYLAFVKLASIRIWLRANESAPY
jgi:transposase